MHRTGGTVSSVAQRRGAATGVQARAGAMDSRQRDTLAIDQEPAMNVTTAITAGAAFELRFQSLFKAGRALAFPCDRDGRVDLDGLSERARDNYLFARTAVGRDYAPPAVLRSASH
jgi:hypothetical protein